MAQSITKYASEVVWGEGGSFSSTSDLKVGRTGADRYYRGRLRFPALIELKNAVIRKVTLRLHRIDKYDTHILWFGVSSSGAWNASAVWHRGDVAIGSGAGVTRNINFNGAKDYIQGFTGNWYVHIRHGDGSNSYTEFAGDEASNSKRPALIVEYENATVEYYTENGWQKCLVYYMDANGNWIQCIPYYYKDGAWVRV